MAFGLLFSQKHVNSSLIRENVSIRIQYMSFDTRKRVFRVSDKVQHKPGCTSTKDGYGLEISDLRNRGIALSI